MIVDEALVDVEPGDTTSARYAIAFDLGTTTVVGTLLDVGTGTPMAVASMLNAQQPFGGDVITRISATMMDKDTLGRLQRAAGSTLSDLAGQVCREAGVDPAHVYEVAVAGNATMTALALGIDPEPLGVAPFVMSAAQPPSVLASEIGLSLHPRARAFFFPALGAYVGGDIVAGMLATGMDRDKRTRLFIDVGTNCEIVLSDGETHPLHRGARRTGVRGRRDPVRDARRRRRHRGDQGRPVRTRRRPGGHARGDRRRRAPRACAGRASSTRWPSWCGSGCSTLRPARPRRGGQGDRARASPTGSTKIGEERVFVLHRPSPETDPAECVYLSQRDVRELQFAKAAISTGWTLLLEQLGLEHRDVQQVLLAGSFGSYLSPASAVRIGLVPKLPGAADRRRGQRRRRGREDGAAVGARAGRRAGAAGGGDLCRALRPPRLQRPVRRAARPF